MAGGTVLRTLRVLPGCPRNGTAVPMYMEDTIHLPYCTRAKPRERQAATDHDDGVDGFPQSGGIMVADLKLLLLGIPPHLCGGECQVSSFPLKAGKTHSEKSIVL